MRTIVVALLIFLPTIRCFLLNVNNTFEDDDENDDGVGVDVAIQQKKSLEQTPPVLGPSGRGINRAHKKSVHKVTQFLSLSLSATKRRRRGRRRPCDEYSFGVERFWFFPLQGKKTASRLNVTCAFTFSQHARLRKKTMSSEDVIEENNALWRLFRHAGDLGGVYRDVVEKHVLPRLNSNDVKFLYEVNTETRKLIKRSSRAGDLKKKFWIEEMSSISTLEFAWEHKSLWSGLYLYDETYFCAEVARTNKLELLKWAREEKKCKWDQDTINTAAQQGNLEMVKYCVANECPIDEDACGLAAENGHLEILKYLREEVKAPWDFWTGTLAAQNGHLHILEYLVEREFDEYDEFSRESAAKFGHLDCLKYLHETAKAPWTSRAVRWAHENKHPECVQYLLYNDCPLPRGWRYEGGALHTN